MRTEDAFVWTPTAGDERKLLRVFLEIEMDVPGKGDIIQIHDEFPLGPRGDGLVAPVQQARYFLKRHLSLAECNERPLCLPNDAKVHSTTFLENGLFHGRYVCATHDN